MKGLPDREEIRELLAGSTKPLNLNSVMHRLKIPRKYRADTKKIMKQLAAEGGVSRKGNRYSGTAPRAANIARGVADIKGSFGFLPADEGEDIFLGKSSTANLLPGDEIEVYVRKSRRGGREGTLKSVIKRTASPLMCRIRKAGRACFCQLMFKETPHIRIEAGAEGFEDGDIALVKVEEKNRVLYGEIVSESYDPGDIKSCRDFILQKYEISDVYPAAAENECSRLSFSREDASLRLDLRDETIVTIDPKDAKDFDDAVSLKKCGSSYELGVHIADVSFYVRPGSQADIEAKKRGTSVYLPGEAIPMLPESLSNGLCSLREAEDKMTFSVFMKIDGRGEILSYEIRETVIRNRKRLTYEEAEEIIHGRASAGAEIDAALKLMNELKNILRERFKRGGNVDFSLGEPVLSLDEQNRVTDITRKQALESHKLIEYFMISANECAADFILQRQGYGIFRVHPKPDMRDIEEFNVFMKALGVNYRIKRADNRDFQEALSSAEGFEKQYLLEKNLLRAMKLASYSEKNTGHFGLGLKKYTHFTSPIRRYADLVAHRIIKGHLGGAGSGNPERGELKKTAAHISDREEKSEKAENEVFRTYALDFLKPFTGQELPAMITKITKNGIVCELLRYPVEGFISYESMDDDYYVFDEERLLATGRRKKKTYRIGARVSVIISGINMEGQKMELEICG